MIRIPFVDSEIKIKHNGKFWIFQALKSVSSESLNDKI